MFKKLCKEIKIEFIGSKLDSEEKTRDWQRKINNIEIQEMRFLENYITEFSQYYYKIGHNDINLGMFYDKLPYPINSIINIWHGLKKQMSLYPWQQNFLSKKIGK